jgi:hypothetical protein
MTPPAGAPGPPLRAGPVRVEGPRPPSPPSGWDEQDLRLAVLAELALRYLAGIRRVLALQEETRQLEAELARLRHSSAASPLRRRPANRASAPPAVHRQRAAQLVVPPGEPGVQPGGQRPLGGLREPGIPLT